MATRGNLSNWHIADPTSSLTSTSGTRRDLVILEHTREPLDGNVSEETEDFELENDDEEEADNEYDGSADEMVIDEEMPEEARAEIEYFNRHYAHTRTQRGVHFRDEVERRQRMNDTAWGEREPDRLLQNPFYNSNTTVSNIHRPHVSDPRLAREALARRQGSSDPPHGLQEPPRRRIVSSGDGINRQGRTSTERREPDPSAIDRYLAEAPVWTLRNQRAYPGIDPARLPPFIEVDESHELGLGVELINPPPARTTPLNDTSSLASESLAVRSTIPNLARRPVIEHPFHPLNLGTSVSDATESSLPAGGDIANGSLEQTSESNPGPQLPSITDTSRPRKRHKSARARATGDPASQPGTSRTPSHGDMSRRPFRRRRRPANSTADEFSPTPLLGQRPSGRTGVFFQHQATPQTNDTESRPPLIRRASASASSSHSELLALPPRTLSTFDAALIEAANARSDRRNYILPLDQISEAMRLRDYELLTQHSVRVPTDQRHLLPALEYCRSRHLIFTSELIPRTFAAQKRRDILGIFKNKAPYVPACISSIPGKPRIQYHVTTSRQPFRSSSPSRFQSKNRRCGSLKELPVEIFEHIARYCSHDTLKKMRLVNRDFENKLSNRVFGTSVVPFNLGIYGMMVHDSPAKGEVDTESKGKAGKSSQNFSAKEVDDGMKIFKAWGNNVRKFAMAFEVDEEQLCNHPKKGKYEHHTTFWGPYKWPHPFYSRYEVVEGLEKKADEFSCMSLALSYLKEVRELGLSLDSGLGWIAGPDMSDRARLFQEKPRIFGHSHPFHDLDAKKEWASKLHELGLHHQKYEVDGRTIHTAEGPLPRNAYGLYECTVHLGSTQSFLTFSDCDGSTNSGNETLIFGGSNLSTVSPSPRFTPNPLHHIRNLEQGTKDSPFKSASLVPNNLTTAQKEWLLETEWAQRAFLSSYCMALTDNSQTFMNVESLTIAKLSSRYLAALQRDDFWKALPNLNSLTIKVSADFRDIQKTDSGVVEAPDITPSKAAFPFYNLIEGCIANISSIRTLDLGYFGGGEHEVGIFGRNQHVLPAPLYDVTNHRNSDIPSVLSLPYVEHLTLTNCWIAPTTLISLVQEATPEMRTLTLDSVSLTTHYAGNEREPSPLENGVFPVPNGFPRLYDPKIGNLWANRGYTPDPNAQRNANHWLVTGGRKGSWRDVIDKITPGPTIDLLRYAYQHIDVVPEMRTGPLERINFVSCGYVRLPNQQGLDQDGIGEVIVRPTIAALEKRAMDLIPVMMHRNTDLLLGQIVPSLAGEEVAIFRDCFPMTIGWGDDNIKYHNHEDGQPTGGSGRFSGHVEKLLFADDRAVVNDVANQSLLTRRLQALQNRYYTGFVPWSRVNDSDHQTYANTSREEALAGLMGGFE